MQSHYSNSPASAAEVFLKSVVGGDVSALSPEEAWSCAARATAELLAAAHNLPTAVGYRDLPRLTNRQMEILERLTTGEKPKQVREQLCIAESTMGSHLNAINKAFDTHGWLDAVREARRMGIVS